MSAPATPAALRAELEELLAGRALAAAAAERCLDALLDPSTPLAVQAALLTALRAKGETADELAGFARGLLGRARRVPRAPGTPCFDTCGTGGDGTASFNLSTAAALIAAAAGLAVAKHGNRAVSSRCGSADVVEALDLSLPVSPEDAGARLARDGFVFLFAPRFHPALAALAVLRRQLGVRTIFNLVGPLVNPAAPSHRLIGTATAELARRLGRAALRLGGGRTFLVHGDGFDEATPCGPFELLVAEDGALAEHRLAPEDFGLARCRPEDLAGGDARENARFMEALLRGGEHGPVRDAACLNAALVLLLAGRTREPRAALRAAAEVLDDGRAARFLDRLRADGGR